MPQQPEKPQQPQLPNDTRTQAIGSEELPYVNEVEAALARKPRLGALAADITTPAQRAKVIGWLSASFSSFWASGRTLPKSMR